MSWKLGQATKFANQFIETTTLKLGFKPEYDGVPITSTIVVEQDASVVNASGTSVEGGWGIEVTDLFTQLVTDDIAVWFVLGHELSHFFGDQLVAAMGWKSVGGEGTEVIADLIAIYVLTRVDYTWSKVLNAVDTEKEQVFNTVANASHAGQHPAAEDRIAYMRYLQELVEEGNSLPAAAAIILEKWRDR